MRTIVFTIVFGFLITSVAGIVEAQPRRNQGTNPPRQNGNKKQDEKKEEEPPPLPTDQKLLAIHTSFINSAEKLAKEYETKKDFDKAMVVYGEMLKLVPQYEPARQRLNELRAKEATATKVTVEVNADEPWQDSGITVIEGKPITMVVSGAWTFNFTAELGPDGMQIPEELREFNLGSLIAVIDTGNPDDMKPFVVGQEKQFIAEKTGKLYFQMYDNFPKDNKGKLKVEIWGTYEKK